jgi:hypothetical protein
MGNLQIGREITGYKRCAVSEPAPDRSFQRRAWITFDSVVDIKDICSQFADKLSEKNVSFYQILSNRPVLLFLTQETRVDILFFCV